MSPEEFKSIREKLNLTQRQLAQVLRYRRGAMTISEFERKTNPKDIPIHVEMLMQIFGEQGLPKFKDAYTGVEYDWLGGETERAQARTEHRKSLKQK